MVFRKSEGCTRRIGRRSKVCRSFSQTMAYLKWQFRKREDSRKFANDPLTSITRQLESRSRESASSSRTFRRPPPPSRDRNVSDNPPEVQARLSRESSERERALELIRRKKREMAGSATPSTVHGDANSSYGDLFNRREVEEAHKHRERRHDFSNRRWDDDDRSRNRPARRW